jgi:hypothetical protein
MKGMEPFGDKDDAWSVFDRLAASVVLALLVALLAYVVTLYFK